MPFVSEYAICITTCRLSHNIYAVCITIYRLYHNIPFVSQYTVCITIYRLYHNIRFVSQYIYRLYLEYQVQLGCVIVFPVLLSVVRNRYIYYTTDTILQRTYTHTHQSHTRALVPAYNTLPYFILYNTNIRDSYDSIHLQYSYIIQTPKIYLSQDISNPLADLMAYNNFFFMTFSDEYAGSFKMLKHVDAVGKRSSSERSSPPTRATQNGGDRAANPSNGGRSQLVTNLISKHLS
jgi:hypothetical protein